MSVQSGKPSITEKCQYQSSGGSGILEVLILVPVIIMILIIMILKIYVQ